MIRIRKNFTCIFWACIIVGNLVDIIKPTEGFEKDNAMLKNTSFLDRQRRSSAGKLQFNS